MPPSHRELDLGQSFDSPIPTSSVSVPTLDAYASFRSGDSDNIKHPLSSAASPSFPGVDDAPNSSTLAHTWPAQERLRSDTHDKCDLLWALFKPNRLRSPLNARHTALASRHQEQHLFRYIDAILFGPQSCHGHHLLNLLRVWRRSFPRLL